jgi:hypothetical protein
LVFRFILSNAAAEISVFIIAMKFSRDPAIAGYEKPAAKYSDSKFLPPKEDAFAPAFTNPTG